MSKKFSSLTYRIIGILLILCILTILSYRDFLITIKLMLFHFYDFPMLPLDPYYKIILLFDGVNSNIGDHQTEEGWFWQFLRIIPLYVNWIVYKIIPCFQMNAIPSFIDKETYCSIWSISIVNYISGIITQVCFFILVKYKFKRPSGECILILLTSYFVINFLDRYGVDRLSFLYLVIFFLLENKKKFTFLLIVFSILVNEKCTFVICLYYFLKEFEFNKIHKSIIKTLINKKFLLSLFLCAGYFYITITKVKEYFGMNIVDYNYFTLHAITNSLIPVLIILVPFMIFFFNKKILNIFRLKQNFILILIFFLLLGFFVGGTGNMGRYLIYTAAIFMPITNFFIFKLISNLDYFFLFPKYSKIEIIKIFTKH
tara:strand:+ start:3067 stop:4179 length:1113 start_codon:yes stop_codon:yes gene_type:complete